jgi:O-antigen/teichoic acid export membrane protein
MSTESAAATLPQPLGPAAPAPAAAPPALHGRVVRGVAWKAASTVFGQLSRLLVAAILAHLLSPHDYGVAAMVLVFSSLVLVFSDLAFGQALIQRREISEADRSTVFWTSVGAGALLTVLGIGLSWPIAAFYGEPQVQGLFAVLSLGFLIGSLAATQTALLMRDMNFRSLELRDMGATVVGGAVGIVTALNGMGAWAIILQQLTVTAVASALVWVASRWRPRFTYSRASLRDLGGYSANVLGSRLLFYANRNLDNLLIGRFIGPAALGAYAVSYNVMITPMSQISLPLQEVMFPAMSRMQDDLARLRDAWMRANRLVGAITIPGMLGLIAVAPEFVAVVLGPKWDSAVPVLQILAWVGLLQSLQGMNGTILRAVDRTRTLLRYSVVVLVASTIAFVVGLPWGVVGVAAAYAISSTIIEPYYTWLTTRAVGMSLLDFGRNFGGIVQAAVIMLVAVLLAKSTLVDAGLGDAPRLLALVLVGVLIYGACVAWRAPEVLEELDGLRRRGLRS